MQKKQEITYEQATEEIQQIIEQIENEQIDIDSLAQKVKRVSFLLDFCKKKLFTTEEYIQNLLNNNED